MRRDEEGMTGAVDNFSQQCYAYADIDTIESSDLDSNTIRIRGYFI
jgi:hypothetical protein